MNLKVGDVVKIRQWEDMEKDKNFRKTVSDLICPIGVHFVPAMKKYCGKSFKISDILDRMSRFSINTGDGESWSFTESMFEQEKFVPTHIVINDGKTFTTYDGMAKLLRATKWERGNEFDNGTEVKLLRCHAHEDQKDKTCCLVTDGKKEVIIGLEGLKVINDDKIKSTRHSIYLAPLIDVSGSMMKDFKCDTKTTIKKEIKPMARINTSVLEKMADSTLNTELELAGTAGLPKNIREALEEQLAEESKNAAKEAAKEIVKLFKSHDVNVENAVKEIRDLRKREAAVKAQIEQINRAKEYGIETGNYLALAVLCGDISIYDLENRELGTIPKDWKPAEKKAE